MDNMTFDVLLHKKDNIFDLDIGDESIRIDGLTGEDLDTLLSFLSRFPEINVVCFPSANNE